MVQLEVELDYFANCRGCREVLDLLRRIGEERGGEAAILTKDLASDPEAIPRVNAMLDLYMDAPRVRPSMILFVGDRALLGEEAIVKRAGALVREQLARGGGHLALRRPEAVPTLSECASEIGLLTVIAAGPV